MKQFLLTVFVTLLIIPAFAGFPSIEGQLVDTFGDPNLETDVDFKVEIFAPSTGCMMSEEIFDNGGSGFDLSATKGSFALNLGGGSPTYHGTSAGYGDVFGANPAGQGLAACAAATAVGDARDIVVSYSLDSGSTWNSISTPMVYGGAASSATLNGMSEVDFIQVSPNIAQTEVDHIMSVLFPASNPAANNYVLTADGAGSWSLSVAAGGGTVTSVGAGTGLTGGPITGAGTLAVDVGTGANQIVQLDAGGLLPAVDASALTNLSAANISGALPALDGNALTNLNSGSLSGALPALDGNALTNLNSGSLSGALPALDGSALIGLPTAPVTSVHSRTGVVVSANGDYTASEVTNVAAGSVAAITVQAAIDELDTEKLALAGGNMTAALTMNAENEVRFADSVGGEYAAIKAPNDLAANYTLTLPVNDGAANEVLQTDGSGVLSWVAQTSGADDLGNHITTTNIQLGANYLSGDGGNEGLSIDASGNATFSANLAVTGITTVTNSIIHPAGAVGSPAITFTGDVDTGLFSPATDQVAVSVGGSEQMRVAAGGVGIGGVTAPSSKLHVGGQVTVGPSGVSPGQTGAIRLEELAANGSEKIILRAPDSIATNFALTFPSADGTTNQVLGTDGSGQLQWLSDNMGATALDQLSDASTSTGTNTLFLGQSSVGNSGGDNTGVGFDSLSGSISGSRNTALGSTSLRLLNGASDNNTAIGAEAMQQFSGAGVLSNTAVGERALRGTAGASGDDNVGIGKNAGESISTGSNNVFVGSLAGSANTSGIGNVLLGKSAGSSLTSGGSNIIIGNNENASAPGVSDEINIGGTIYGDRLNDRVAIGAGGANPGVELMVNGTKGVGLPAGTTAQRPGSPAQGMVRYNSTENTFEGYVNGSWAALNAGLVDCSGLPANTGATPATGWTLVGNPGEPGTFCITAGTGGSVNGGATYNGAKASCEAVGGGRGHLCTPKEMFRACRLNTGVTIGANELVDDIVFNGGIQALRIQYNGGACDYVDSVGMATGGQAYRCCYQ